MSHALVITNKTIVYLLCPANYNSGGPEAIHRLCDYFREMKADARIVFFPISKNNNINNNYIDLDIKIETEIIDDANNIIIVPELYRYIKFINNFKKIRKCIWWLSVDNFYLNYIDTTNNKIINKIHNIFFKLMDQISKINPNLLGNRDKIRYYNHKIGNINSKIIKELSEIDVNLCQSYYAEKWLKSLGFNNTNFLGDKFSQKIINAGFDASKKKKIVAYNPLKGINFTRKLIKKYKNLVFIPIDKMSKLEVIDLLKDAMIYIDFGNHPGQDRIPREAAIYGCCLITSKRGSAAYKQDIPIPEKYKINDEDINLDKIGNLIIEIFNNYNYKFAEFECYRNYCKLTNDRFINDFYKCFKIIK